MLVTKDPIRHEIPHESGEWFDLIKLSWKKLKKSKRRATSEQMEVMSETARAFGGANFVQQALDEAAKLDKAGKATEVVQKAAKKGEYDESNFDTETLILAGIAGWSYDAEVNAETIAELDEATASWAKQAIIDLTKPPTEEDRKNS